MKNIKINNFILLIFCTISLLFIQTIAYSALSSTMKITGNAYARVDADIRVTDFLINSVSQGALSSYEEFGKNNLASTVTLPNSDSYVIYKVNVSNYGNAYMGIKSIDGLHENLSYELIDYTLKDKLCDSTNKCNLGSVSTFYIKIKYNNYDSSNTIYSINLNISFEQIYNITYDGITNNNYPSSIMKGETLNISFTNQIPKVIPYSNGEKLSNYNYDNNNLTVSDVKSDINVVYKEKVYMTTLPDEQYFKESTHLTKIKKVYFVNYLDEGEHLAEWDLSKNSDGTIIGWIDNSTDYNLYIGSDWNIYSKDLSRAFNNMTGVTNIYFNNLNTSECVNMHYMFQGTSNITELDVSTLNTSEATNMARMFQGMSSLKSIDVSNFDTSKTVGFYSMFSGCSSIVELDLSNFDTKNAETMFSMFNGMHSLEKLDISSFYTRNLDRFEMMFNECKSLTTLDLTHFDTSNAVTMYNMFSNSDKLRNIDISSFDTSKVTNMKHIFENCYSLENIYVGPGWDTSLIDETTQMFYGSTKLPNYDNNNTLVTKAYVGDGGYLKQKTTFKIQGETYIAEKNQTWADWIASDYNTLGLIDNNGYVYTSDYMTFIGTPNVGDGYTYYSYTETSSVIDDTLHYMKVADDES